MFMPTRDGSEVRRGAARHREPRQGAASRADVPARSSSHGLRRGLNLDKSTRLALREIASTLVAALGATWQSLSPVQAKEVARVSELQLIAQQRRLSALRGEPGIDLDGVIRLENAVDRAMRRLGVKPGAVAANAGPSLTDYLATLSAETAADSSEAERTEADSGEAEELASALGNGTEWQPT